MKAPLKCILLILLIANFQDNANAQWQQITSGTTETLNDIYFSDSLNGYCVGEGGAILKSTNGGINWNIIYQDTSTSFKKILLVNDTIYISALNNGSNLIFKSTDGGMNWNINTTSFSILNWQSYFDTIYFADVNSIFFKTYDFITIDTLLSADTYIFDITSSVITRQTNTECVH